jgi:cysteine desulfurase/selenocysteine lyase
MVCDRRTFIETASALAAAAARPAAASVQAAAGASSSAWRQAFPALVQHVNGHPLAYLDSAATTHRPRAVIDAIAGFYAADNANPGAALHTLARRAAGLYGSARAAAARFINAASPAEVIFTKGTTEAINLVASAWGSAQIGRGDEILLTVAEHYSNLLPWRALAERAGARITVVDVDDHGRLLPARIRDAMTPRTKLLAFSHVSNVLGIVNPAPEICAVAKERGVPVLIDAAQSAPHVRLDVQALGCDFLAFSGHKILGPMGVGVLWVKQETLEVMPPYQLGSNMAHEVEAASMQLETGAPRYQAGTPNVSGAVGLAAAIETLERFDLAAIRRHDAVLVEHARRRLSDVPGLRVMGTLDGTVDRLPVFTFTVAGVPMSRIVRALDERGIAVRGGDMAALPLLRRFGASEAVRASCYLYTTTDEIDRLVDVMAHEAARA